MRLSRVCVALAVTLWACADPRYGTLKGMEADVGLDDAPRQGLQDTGVGGSPSVGDAASDTSMPVGTNVSDAATSGDGASASDSALASGSVFAGDAATAGDPTMSMSPGGAPVVTVQFPDWAAPLIGTYATRAFSFSKDRLGIVSMFEELALVNIVRVGPGAELRSKLCSQVATSTQDVLRLIDPSGLAETTRQITFDDAGHWGSEGVPIGFGYDRAVPASCAGKENQPIPKSAAHVWLGDTTCRCPSSADAAPRIDDCRVLDPDNDNKPGLSYRDRGKPTLIGSFINTTLHVAVVSRTHAVSGRVDAQGAHHAQLVVDEVAYQLSCEPDGCPQIADIGRPCTSEFNDVHFVPLTKDSQVSNCAELLARAAALFPAQPPATPTTCGQQALTDDPTRR